MPEALHNYFLNKLNKRTGQGTEQEQTLHAKESKELSKSIDKIKFWELVFHQYSLGVLSCLFDFFFPLHTSSSSQDLNSKISQPDAINYKSGQEHFHFFFIQYLSAAQIVTVMVLST